MARKTTRSINTSPVDDPATAYARAVVAGSLPAGPHVRGGCKRHLDDLKRQGTRDFPFVWNRPETDWNPPTPGEHDTRDPRPPVDRVISFFHDVLRLNGGEHEGQPFAVLPWQAFILGSIFGWKRKASGYRRFRQSYIETGKGSGKSPLAAGVGLYCLTGDKEPRAEVYAAASKKDQAQVLFRDAVAMVKQSPALKSRLGFTGGEGKEWNIDYLQTGSFFRTVASEDNQSGPRPHCGLLDEIHEHKDDTAVNLMRAGTKGRRQALIFMITNSGADRTGICFNYHEYAAKVCRGDLRDDAFFAYVCAVDSERTEVLSGSDAFRFMRKTCTCKNVPNALTLRCLPEDFVAHATSENIGKSGALAAAAEITLTGQSAGAGFAACAMTGKSSDLTRQRSRRSAKRSGVGTNETGIASENTSGLGSPSGPDTGKGKPATKNYGITESTPTASWKSLSREAERAPYATASPNFFALTTATQPGVSEGFCAGNVTPVSDFSGILREALVGHLPTCPLSNASLSRETLTVRLPADNPLKDESCWPKANPSLGHTFQMDYLRELVTEARGMPSKESVVLRLNFCVWTDTATPWIDRDLWDACEADFDTDENAGVGCYLGLDLSAKRDLTSAAACWDHPDGRLDLAAYFWTPGDTLDERARDDSVPYRAWKEQGHLFAPPGRIVDKRDVARWAQAFCVKHNVRALAFDNAQIDDFLVGCDDIGFEVWIDDRKRDAEGAPIGPEGEGVRMVRHGQGFAGFASDHVLWMPRSVNAVEESIVKGRLRIKRNPVLRWNSASAVLASDPSGNRRWDKRKATGRIDGMVAACMAVGAAEAPAPAVKVSIWDRPEFAGVLWGDGR